MGRDMVLVCSGVRTTRCATVEIGQWERDTERCVMLTQSALICQSDTRLFSCLDPGSIVRGSPTLTIFFLVDAVREDPNTTISGPSLAHQQNAIKMAFRWCANDGPTFNAGLVALCFFRGSGPVLLRNPIFF